MTHILIAITGPKTCATIVAAFFNTNRSSRQNSPCYLTTHYAPLARPLTTKSSHIMYSAFLKPLRPLKHTHTHTAPSQHSHHMPVEHSSCSSYIPNFTQNMMSKCVCEIAFSPCQIGKNSYFHCLTHVLHTQCHLLVQLREPYCHTLCITYSTCNLQQQNIH